MKKFVFSAMLLTLAMLSIALLSGCGSGANATGAGNLAQATGKGSLKMSVVLPSQGAATRAILPTDYVTVTVTETWNETHGPYIGPNTTPPGYDRTPANWINQEGGIPALSATPNIECGKYTLTAYVTATPFAVTGQGTGDLTLGGSPKVLYSNVITPVWCLNNTDTQSVFIPVFPQISQFGFDQAIPANGLLTGTYYQTGAKLMHTGANYGAVNQPITFADPNITSVNTYTQTFPAGFTGFPENPYGTYPATANITPHNTVSGTPGPIGNPSWTIIPDDQYHPLPVKTGGTLNDVYICTFVVVQDAAGGPYPTTNAANVPAAIAYPGGPAFYYPLFRNNSNEPSLWLAQHGTFSPAAFQMMCEFTWIMPNVTNPSTGQPWQQTTYCPIADGAMFTNAQPPVAVSPWTPTVLHLQNKN